MNNELNDYILITRNDINKLKIGHHIKYANSRRTICNLNEKFITIEDFNKGFEKLKNSRIENKNIKNKNKKIYNLIKKLI